MEDTVRYLEQTARKCRQHILRMIKASGHGHIGGAFSSIDLMVYLYFHRMNVDPSCPNMPERDRLILSAGHKCLALYAVLAEKGFFPMELLDTFGKLHSRLPGHPDMHKLPGVEANTGALGHGLSLACGIALGLRINHPQTQVYVLLGDGELAEGSNWEAISLAAHHQLGNLILFVDHNDLQISGRVHDVMSMEPMEKRFSAFGWDTVEIDGNDMNQILSVLDSLHTTKDKPTVVIAHTVKCKGLSFAEGVVSYHYWSPTPEEMLKAEIELSLDS